jgi:ferrous iron transport protein A
LELSDLSVGDHAKITGYLPTNYSYRKKLLIMGLVPGTEITLTGIAPLGDPVQIAARGLSLCLRKKEASVMKLEKV